MNLLVLTFFCISLLLLGYFIYGYFLKKILKLDPNIKTPSHTLRDGLDYEPAGKHYLLGQHLSAIAAAGPIVGPILAGMWFGWLPTIIWIIIGGIFVGGVHDFTALVASIRHKGMSIAEVIRENMSKKAFVIFLLFLWFSIIYIITAFTDITASTFVDKVRGPEVASSSMMYLTLALIMGILLRKFRFPLFITTLIFLPLVFVCINLGPVFPLHLPPFFGLDQRTSWDLVLLGYCFFASIIPVWLLLQPRGYLGGFFLAFTAGVSFLGLVIGNFIQHYTIQYPAFIGWANPQGLPLLPLLFTTVACGACSGFHAIVSSGTTSKQIDKETDAKLVGYGGMLLESFVAIIALGTLLILTTNEANKLQDPNQIYANGIATFLGNLGIKKEFALNFALLAFATFVYDTLDVATRLGRYIFQELTGVKGKRGAYIATFATLILPVTFIVLPAVMFMSCHKGLDNNAVPTWKIFWTIFGSSNQLLAALVLLGISVWLFKKKINSLFTLIPSIFMIIVAVLSLVIILKPWLLKILGGNIFIEPMAITGIILLILAVLLIAEVIKVFKQKS